MTVVAKTNATRRAALAGWLVAGIAAALPVPALAWKAYHLEGNLWAIRCNDNTLWSYSGSSAGLGTVGPALCDGHGGIAGGGGGPDIVPAPVEVRRIVEGGCMEKGPWRGAQKCTGTPGTGTVTHGGRPAGAAADVAGGKGKAVGAGN